MRDVDEEKLIAMITPRHCRVCCCCSYFWQRIVKRVIAAEGSHQQTGKVLCTRHVTIEA
jgi:hypothetical protein